MTEDEPIYKWEINVRNLLKIAAPLTLVYVLTTLYNIVDLFWVGMKWSALIAAVGPSGIIDDLFINIGMGLSMASMAMVARYIGANEPEKAQSVAWHSLLFCTILSVIITLVGLPAVEPILRLIQIPEEILPDAIDYLSTLVCGYFFMSLYFFLGDILRGAGDVRTPTIALAFGVVSNAILDPIFIFGFGPIPSLGVFGAALATVLTRGFASLWMLIVLIKGRSIVKLRRMKFEPSIFKKMFTVGLPSSAERLIMNVSNIVLTAIVSPFGTSALAAYSTTVRIRDLVVQPSIGFGSASGIFIGQNMGAGEPEKGEKATWLSVASYQLFMIPTSIILFIFAPYIISAFNPDREMLALGTAFMRITCVSFPFMAMANIAIRSFIGAGDTVPPFIIRFTCNFLMKLLLSWGLSLLLAENGIWIGVTVALTIQGIVAGLWFRSGRWKSKQL
jgi:putative MATE family efflux protein